MTSPAPAIEVVGLTKKFGDLTAVDGVTLRVEEGEVFGFLGPNGAGKTTTVRMLCCLISKTSGEARIGGYDVGNDADSLKIRKLIGLVPDNVGLYDDLTRLRQPGLLREALRLHGGAEEGEHRALPHDAGALGEEGRHGGDVLEGDEAEARHSARPHPRPAGALHGRADGEPRPRVLEDGAGTSSSS